MKTFSCEEMQPYKAKHTLLCLENNVQKDAKYIQTFQIENMNYFLANGLFCNSSSSTY